MNEVAPGVASVISPTTVDSPETKIEFAELQELGNNLWGMADRCRPYDPKTKIPFKGEQVIYSTKPVPEGYGDASFEVPLVGGRKLVCDQVTGKWLKDESGESLTIFATGTCNGELSAVNIIVEKRRWGRVDKIDVQEYGQHPLDADKMYISDNGGFLELIDNEEFSVEMRGNNLFPDQVRAITQGLGSQPPGLSA